MKNFRFTFLLFFLISPVGNGLWAQCLPTFTNDCSEDNIDGVVFNTISNTASGCAGALPNNYTDFSATFSTTVAQGASYDLTITIGPLWGENVGAWIDYNQNGDFSDPGEFYDFGGIAAGGSNTVSVTIDPLAVVGTTTMRVIAHYGGPLTSTSSCDPALDYGEAEDYAVNIILPPSVDAQLNAFNSPTGGCGLGMEQVCIQISNPGLSDITGFDVGYIINGGTPIVETISSTIDAGSFLDYCFTTMADLSVFGTYNFDVFVSATGDANTTNDSFQTSVENIPVLTSFPFYEDFESGPGSWTTYGNNSSWDFGTPAGTYITNAASGVNAWVTNLVGDYSNSEDSYLESPCMDFSGFSNDPVLLFNHIYETEGCCDEGWVEISIDGGATWNKLGLLNSGINWYNDVDYWNGNSGVAGDWREARHTLVGTAGLSSVKVRFAFSSDGSVVEDGFGVDDIMVLGDLLDLAANEIDLAIPECGYSTSEIISASFINTSTTSIVNFDVCYMVNGNGPFCETITDTVQIGDTLFHTFLAPADLSVVGDYEIIAFGTLAGDVLISNDSTSLNVTHDPTINTFPYLENFDSWTVNIGPNVPLPSGWTNDLMDNGQDWWINNVPTPSTGTGPDADHTTGSDNYLYVEDSGFDNDTISLISPCFDLTGLNSVLNFWYHSNNANGPGGVGMNHLIVEVYSGGSWTILDSIFHVSGNWEEATYSLVAFTNNIIKIRLRSSNNNTDYVHDIAIDDFGIDVLVGENLETNQITSPLTDSCGYGSVPICADIMNPGLLPMLSYDLSYSINGGSAITETIGVPIASGDTLNHCFGTLADLSVPGMYSISVWVTAPGDTINGNDTAWQEVSSIPTISTFPFYENFESGPGGWTQYGSNSSWEFGTPAGPYITNAASGVNAWVTNLAGDYNNSEDSYLESPCMDFSGLTQDPILIFNHIYQTESCCDEGWVEYSIDDGATWTKVGFQNSGVNWYNDIDYWNDASGNAGEWRIARHTLNATAGEPSVKLRFTMSSDGSVTGDGFGVDDVSIVDFLIDLAAENIDMVSSDCGLSSAETVIASFINFSNSPIVNFDVCYMADGNGPFCETITDTVFVGDTLVHSFMTTVDLSTVGTHSISVYGNVAGDILVSNDTMSTMVDNLPIISSFPYVEDFETGQAYWSQDGTNSTWEFGTPAKPTITGASSGVNAWVNGGLTGGAYNANEMSWVMSPCFDLTSVGPNPWMAVDIWYDSEGGWDGTSVQYTTDGQTWTQIGLQGDPINWYNDNINSIPPGGLGDAWAGSNGGYVTARHNLDGLSGEPKVMFRMAFASDGSGQNEGVAFDNFIIANVDTVDLGPDSLMCGVSSYTLSSPAADSILWSSGNTTSTEVVTTSGEIHVTIMDSLGFTGSDTVNIGLGPLISVDLGMDTVLCSPDSVTLSVMDPNATNILWSTGETTPSIQTDSTILISVIASSVEGCSDMDTISVSIIASPTIDLGPDSIYCGDTISISTGLAGADNYLWSSGGNTDMIEITSSGTYWVEVTACGVGRDTVNITLESFPSFSLGSDTAICGDSFIVDPQLSGTFMWSDGSIDPTYTFSSGGIIVCDYLAPGGNCLVSDDISVMLNTIPTPDVGIDTILCEGTPYSVSSGAIGNHLWNTGDTTSSISLTMTGTYSVMVTTPEGCTGYDSMEITINPLPVIDLGADTTVCGEITLDAGNPGSIYDWTSGGSDQSETISSSGTVSVYVTDINGCWAMDSVNVTIGTFPITDIGPDQAACEGDSIILDGGLGNSYEWSTGDTTASIIVTSSGDYILEMWSSDGCSSMDTIGIMIGALPLVDLGPDQTICGSVTLDAGNPGSNYLWSSGSTDQTLEVTSSGLVSVLVTNTEGCQGNDTANITIESQPSVNLGPDLSICEGDTACFNGPSGTGYTFLWSDNSTDQELCVTQAGNYILSVENAGGCVGMDTVSIAISDVPVTSISLLPSTCPEISFGDGSTGSPFQWAWDFGDGNTSAAPDPTHTYVSGGDFTVTLISTNQCGSDTATGNINIPCLIGVNPLVEGMIKVYPNPSNGVFFLELEQMNFKEGEIEVFNMDGKIIFAEDLSPDNIITEIDLEGFSSAIYLVKIRLDNQFYTDKIELK